MEVVSIVQLTGEGRNVGKTLVGEALARLVARRGWVVAAVKHVHHGVDYRVKDTGRYVSAGASRVVAVGPDEYMVVERTCLSLGDAICLATAGLHGRILVVVEGFSWESSRLLTLGACVAHITRGGRATLRFDDTSVEVELSELPLVLARLLEEGRCRVSRLECSRKA